jgi:hypothetical protein
MGLFDFLGDGLKTVFTPLNNLTSGAGQALGGVGEGFRGVGEGFGQIGKEAGGIFGSVGNIFKTLGNPIVLISGIVAVVYVAPKLISAYTKR